ncbi:T9SS type A sorting domain-containing protein [Crocinitomix algicola]|uniref:T9SS type A sorting domain-containing protein n=1 Tax=Crocinitomix algicola TaxID=1740263 RepID=UPI00087314EC|nr:T9SS type A sorting domain-containing protein [Crocinitomix algicola]
MKKNNQIAMNDFKAVAKEINLHIRTGTWKELSNTVKDRLSSRLSNLYYRLKHYFSKETLFKTLGAAIFLISGNLNAQTFAPHIANPFGIEEVSAYFHQPEFVDLDGDGDLDILTSTAESESFLYQENIGDNLNPEYAEGVLNPFGLLPSYYTYTPRAVDIDGDGDLDIFSTGDYGEYTFYENIGTATEPEFAAEELSPFGMSDTYSFLVGIVDMDNDGDYDIVSTMIEIEGYAYDFGVKYYENTGSATAPIFGEIEGVMDAFGLTPTPSEYMLTFGDLVDFDGDGDFDLMRVDFYGDKIYYHENIGTAEEAEFEGGDGIEDPFGLDVDLPESYTSGVTMVDIDDDSDLDVFFTDYYGGTHFFENKSINIGIDESPESLNLTIFPNPATHTIQIDGDINSQSIELINVMDLNGRTILTFDNKSPLVNVSSLNSGTYILEVQTINGRTITEKFNKQ